MHEEAKLEAVFGPGIGDLQRVALQEVKRIMEEARGDRATAVRLTLQRARELDLVSDDEIGHLAELSDIGFAAARGRMEQADAHGRSRAILDAMLARGGASPVALAFAAGSSHAEVGPAQPGGTPEVVFRKASGNWQDTLGGAGAVIGSVIGGRGGALLGAAIGQITGKIVDECVVDE